MHLLRQWTCRTQIIITSISIFSDWPLARWWFLLQREEWRLGISSRKPGGYFLHQNSNRVVNIIITLNALLCKCKYCNNKCWTKTAITCIIGSLLRPLSRAFNFLVTIGKIVHVESPDLKSRVHVLFRENSIQNQDCKHCIALKYFVLDEICIQVRTSNK